MNDWSGWLHAVRNEANAIGTSLAVAQRSLDKHDTDTLQRFLVQGTQAMDRLRLLLAAAPDVDAAAQSNPARTSDRA